MITKKLQRIQSLLLSTDPELRKLGQKLCHKFRIDYYVECMPCNFRFKPKVKTIYFPVKYSLERIDTKVISSYSFGNYKITCGNKYGTLQKIYKIELCKKS